MLSNKAPCEELAVSQSLIPRAIFMVTLSLIPKVRQLTHIIAYKLTELDATEFINF